jgi:hypothetical protein
MYVCVCVLYVCTILVNILAIIIIIIIITFSLGTFFCSPKMAKYEPKNATEFRFLGAFVKLRKATIIFVMSVRLTFRPHWTTRVPLEVFSWNLVFEYFSKKLPRNFKFS